MKVVNVVKARSAFSGKAASATLLVLLAGRPAHAEEPEPVDPSTLPVRPASAAPFVAAPAPQAPVALSRPVGFGKQGQLFVTADRLMPLVSYTTQSVTMSQGATETKISDRGASFAFFVGREPGLASMHTVPRLAVDYAVVDHLTVGTALPLAFGLGGSHSEDRTQNGGTTSRKHNSPEMTVLGFAPRVGYVLPLSPRFAFWPRAGVAFYSMRTKTEQSNEASAISTTVDTDTLFSLDLDPQVVWSPIDGLFVHAGGIANLPISGAHSTEFSQAASSSTRTDDLSVFRVGLSAGIGGWLAL